MELRAKLQVPGRAAIEVIDCPPGVDVGLTSSDRDSVGVLLFVKDSKALRSRGGPAIVAAKADKLTWIAYPKAGQLDTDLNRDKLWALLKPSGIRPVRQVSIDETWSALRFRPVNKR
jgi:hypothetical protein